MGPDPLEENKRLVSKVFEVAYGQGDNFHLLDEVIAEDYVQHSPNVGQGREGVKRFFMEQMVPLPDWLDARGTVAVNLIAEGEFVVRQEIRTHGMLVDIFRVKDGLLREHWDAYRPNPGTPDNPFVATPSNR
jgi:predicted SnoaL-like aldol condensation-catalyzing enzyme